MNTVAATANAAPSGRSALHGWWPAGVDRVALLMLVIGWFALYLPVFADLSDIVWSTDEQGQGPAILAISYWLLWRQRHALAALPARGWPVLGTVLCVLALLCYWVGRTQEILIVATGTQILLLTGLLLVFRGPGALRLAWFPLLFILFMLPLPGTLVSAATAPLKSAVSYVAAELLHALGYPVARSGVVLMVGPYQLLVADACAGLTSMFTLEALGMLYMNLQNYTSALRNVVLAVLLVPISFVANAVRVMMLVLVTVYFGNEAGQGFVHAYAGVLLFLVAILLMLAVDRLLDLFFARRRAA